MRFPAPLSPSAIPWLARLHNTHFNGIAIAPRPNVGLSILFYPHKYDPTFPLLAVDRELVLCADKVQLVAQSDSWVRDLICACCCYGAEEGGEGGEKEEGLGGVMGKLRLDEEESAVGNEETKKKIKSWGRNPRIMILLFLVVMVLRGAISEQEEEKRKEDWKLRKGTERLQKHKRLGAGGIWLEYIKLLPTVSIPTTWTDEERELLKGTSLEPAIGAKMSSLLAEFHALKSLTSKIPWCQERLWNHTDPFTFMNWKTIDAWYRSRVLQLPELGLCLVPFLDMANHSGLYANAYYNVDENGDVALLPSEAQDLSAKFKLEYCNKPELEPIEVRINYGFDKSSAELLFSYGFISTSKILSNPPSATSSCLWLALSLDFLSDDPLKPAKEAVLTTAPTVRLYDSEKEDHVEWASEFVWLICANTEDGLEFKIANDIEGNRNLEMVWVPPPLPPAVAASRRGSIVQMNLERREEEQEAVDGAKEYPVTNLAALQAYMEKSLLYPVYLLRAIVTISNRVKGQLESLRKSIEEDEENEREGIRKGVFEVVQDLKVREKVLLEKALRYFEKERDRLVEDEVVRAYLDGAASDFGNGSDVEICEKGIKLEDMTEEGENEEDLA